MPELLGIDTAVVYFGNEYVYRLKKYIIETEKEIELLTLQKRNRSKRFHMMVIGLKDAKRKFPDYHLKLMEEIRRKYHL